jgi:hypothetical protein
MVYMAVSFLKGYGKPSVHVTYHHLIVFCDLSCVTKQDYPLKSGILVLSRILVQLFSL